MRDPIARLAWSYGRLVRLISSAGRRTSGRLDTAIENAVERWRDAYERGADGDTPTE